MQNIDKKAFGDKKKHRKVRDHDHYTGKYCGATHSICNFHIILHKMIYLFCFISVVIMILT